MDNQNPMGIQGPATPGDNEMRVTHMDEMLKQLAATYFNYAFQASIAGRYRDAFESWKMLFFLIKSHDFTLKKQLDDLTDIMTKFLESMGQTPVDSESKVRLAKDNKRFVDLLDTYMTMVMQAYRDLGLWFKTVSVKNDVDHQFSNEFFDSDLKSLQKKKDRLKKYETRKLVNVMSPNTVHEVEAKLSVNEALGDTDTNRDDAIGQELQDTGEADVA